MTPNETKPAFSSEEQKDVADTPMTDRRPWDAPALERLDLREAMAAGVGIPFDGVTSS
jgi:hypothetical protein